MYWVPHLAVPNFMLVYTVNLFIHAYAEWVYRVYMHHTTLTCKLHNSQSDISGYNHSIQTMTKSTYEVGVQVILPQRRL